LGITNVCDPLSNIFAIFFLFHQDLDEDVVITLTAKNPQAAHSIVRFDYTSGEYVGVRRIETMIDHLEIESTSLHKDSHEAQEQLQIDGGVKEGDLNFDYFELLWVKLFRYSFLIQLMIIAFNEDRVEKLGYETD
jgi:hypothetical protein